MAESDNFFEFGEYVRMVQNPHLCGQVVNEQDWGMKYQVRLSDGLTTAWYNYFEIEHDPDMDEPDEVDPPIIVATGTVN